VPPGQVAFVVEGARIAEVARLAEAGFDRDALSVVQCGGRLAVAQVEADAGAGVAVEFQQKLLAAVRENGRFHYAAFEQ
jgi:hypothetical protein